MFKAACLSAATASLLALAAPAFAGDIAGAGSGSMGGTVTGKTNESNSMMQTGVDTGQQPTTTPGKPQSGNAVPDNAVMTAPREAKPGTTGSNQPSNLSGQ